MKKIVIVAAMLFSTCLLLGQETQASPSTAGDGASEKKESNQLNEMVIDSLRHCMKFNADFHNKFFKDEAPPKIYVCKDGLPADFPFEDMPNVGFFTLWNLSGLPKFFQKELEKGISAYYVGIKLTDRQIVIAIGSYGVTLIKKDHIRRGLGDRWIFTYEYSCEKQKWLLAKTE